MRLHPFYCILLFSVSVFGQDAATPLDQLTRDVDAASSAVEPQRIFDTPEATKLSEFIQADMESNQAEATIHWLGQRHEAKPSWQVVVEAVWSRFSDSAPTTNDVAILESLFTATIKEGDHWLNYSSPRGWTNPYFFRSRLAHLILFARTGAPQEIDDESILRDNPSKWLSQLKPIRTQPAFEYPSSTVTAATVLSQPIVQTPAPESAPEATITHRSNEEPTLSTSWSVITVRIVVFLVAAAGLLWLLLKK